MLLGRRHAPMLSERLRVAFWPRRSWRRSLRYGILRLERLHTPPHALGLGLAIGVFAAFQPIVGFQMLFAGLLAWALGASVAAAMAGTFIGCPATWPFMWVASYHLGALITGSSREVSAKMLWQVLTTAGATASTGQFGSNAVGALFWQVMQPLAVGAVPLGLLFGAVAYAMVQRVARLRP